MWINTCHILLLYLINFSCSVFETTSQKSLHLSTLVKLIATKRHTIKDNVNKIKILYKIHANRLELDSPMHILMPSYKTYFFIFILMKVCRPSLPTPVSEIYHNYILPKCYLSSTRYYNI